MTIVRQTPPSSPASGSLPYIGFSTHQAREDQARQVIAYLFAGGYLAVLVMSFIPALLYLLQHPNLTLADIKDLGGVIAVGVSSLSGLLGFVLGYYLKSTER